MSRIKPPVLKPGDKIAIAATARKVSVEEMAPAITLFNSWGLDVVTHPKLFDAEHQFAGSDSVRIQVFNDYLADAEIKAIICARGGYGTVRIVDAINMDALRQQPKWVVGYSDITVLHSHLVKQTGVCTLHATMPINMQAHNLNERSVNALRDVLTTGVSCIDCAPNALNRLGEAEAMLVGGNLSVLYSLLGSESDIDTDGKILFLEDLDEYLYHIDRMMQALKRSGKLDRLAGLIVGGMSDMKDNAVPFGADANQIIASIVAEYDYPVCFGFPAGHEALNMPLIMGAPLKLNVSSNLVKINQI